MHEIDNIEPNRDNIAQLIDSHVEKWNPSNGGAWWVEDFMASNGLWFTDFRRDLAKVLQSIPPKKINDLDELKKFLLAYFKPKLLKPDAKPRNTPRPAKQEAIAPKHEHTTFDYTKAQEIITPAKSKNEAMSLLRKAGYANKDIASFMGLKPGRVASGIRAYDKAHN